MDRDNRSRRERCCWAVYIRAHGRMHDEACMLDARNLRSSREEGNDDPT
jgi:hypothetical protein